MLFIEPPVRIHQRELIPLIDREPFLCRGSANIAQSNYRPNTIAHPSPLARKGRRQRRRAALIVATRAGKAEPAALEWSTPQEVLLVLRPLFTRPLKLLKGAP